MYPFYFDLLGRQYSSIFQYTVKTQLDLLPALFTKTIQSSISYLDCPSGSVECSSEFMLLTMSKAVVHRWGLPTVLLIETYTAEHINQFQHNSSVSSEFICRTFPVRHPRLVVQSSVSVHNSDRTGSIKSPNTKFTAKCEVSKPAPRISPTEKLLQVADDI